METLIKQRYRILNEQYYGSNKYLDNIDKAFQKILDNRGNYLEDGIKFLDICRPYLDDIEKNLEELFNFKKVYLDVEGDGTYNAYTMGKSLSDPVMFNDNMNEKELGPYGIRYKKKVRSVVVRIFYDLFFNPKITNRTLTAILLHEIGHNFYVESTVIVIAKKVDVIYEIKKAFDKSKNPIVLINGLVYTLMHMRSFEEFKDELTKRFNSSDFGKAMKVISMYMGTLSNLASLITFYTVPLNPNRRFLTFEEKITRKLLNLGSFHGLTLYRNELFADNFATTYGYGPEILEMSAMFATSHTGIHAADAIAEKSKVFAAFNDFMLKYDKFFFDIFTTRADSYARMLDQISYLEKNIENYEDQANKEQMLAELERCKKIMSKFDDSFDILADGSVYKKGQIMTGINLSLFKLTKGGISYNVRKYEGAAGKKGKWNNLL